MPRWDSYYWKKYANFPRGAESFESLFAKAAAQQGGGALEISRELYPTPTRLAENAPKQQLELPLGETQMAPKQTMYQRLMGGYPDGYDDEMNRLWENNRQQVMDDPNAAPKQSAPAQKMSRAEELAAMEKFMREKGVTQVQSQWARHPDPIHPDNLKYRGGDLSSGPMRSGDTRVNQLPGGRRVIPKAVLGLGALPMPSTIAGTIQDQDMPFQEKLLRFLSRSAGVDPNYDPEGI